MIDDAEKSKRAMRETELNTSGRTGVASKSVPSLRCFLLTTGRHETLWNQLSFYRISKLQNLPTHQCSQLCCSALSLHWDQGFWAKLRFFAVVFLLWTVTLFPLCCLCDSSGNSDAAGKHWEEGKLKGCLSLFKPTLPLDEANVSAVPPTASNHRCTLLSTLL